MGLKVDFQFREPTETFDRNGSINISVPGTTVTPKMAQYVAQQFLTRFESTAPVAGLRSARCTVEGTGQKVFDIEFHVASGDVPSSRAQ